MSIGGLLRLSNPFTCQRWPAIRPDDVVPKVIFDATIQNSQVKEDFNTAITTRTKWNRGLRDTGEASPALMLFTLVSQYIIVVFFSPSQTNWPGSDDMVKYWRYLGIVREVKDVFTDEASNEYTAFLEDERVSV